MSTLDPLRFIAVLHTAARQAGAVALHLKGKVPVERKSADGTPESEVVTAVDRAAQDVLLLRLHEAFPEAAIDAEEDTEAVALFPPCSSERPLVVIDPLDGTLAYTRGSDDWAVMGGLIEGGVLTASLVLFPVADLACWAIRGGGAWVTRGRERARRIEAPPHAPAELLIAPYVPSDRVERADGLGLRPMRSHVSAVDSTAPALGRARASIAGDRADRRRALGLLATLECGGAVRFGERTWQGEDPARFGPEDAPTVAAVDAELAEQVVRAFGR